MKLKKNSGQKFVATKAKEGGGVSKFSLNRHLKISLHSRNRALDLNFAKIRIGNPGVVVVCHVTIVAIGHGLFWPLVLGCVLRTAGSSII